MADKPFGESLRRPGYPPAGHGGIKVKVAEDGEVQCPMAEAKTKGRITHMDADKCITKCKYAAEVHKIVRFNDHRDVDDRKPVTTFKAITCTYEWYGGK
jgi:hypothetical protein